MATTSFKPIKVVCAECKKLLVTVTPTSEAERDHLKANAKDTFCEEHTK